MYTWNVHHLNKKENRTFFNTHWFHLSERLNHPRFVLFRSFNTAFFILYIVLQFTVELDSSWNRTVHTLCTVVQLSWLDCTALFRSLCLVPLSLPRLHCLKWRVINFPSLYGWQFAHRFIYVHRSADILLLFEQVLEIKII